VHLTSSPVDWYAARAAGVAAYVLLSAVVVLGMTMGGKKTLPRWPRFALEDVHRFGGLLVGTFIGIHVLTIAIDSWLPFSIGALVVPLVSTYKPIWVGLGIVAAELLLALAVTNHYRDRLEYRFWRRAHYANFGVWGAATLHGLGSGTDRSAPWLVAIYALCTGTVVAAIAWRVTRGRLHAAPVLAAAVVAVAVVAVARGPLQFHPRHWNAVAFHDRLTGQVVRQSGVTRGIVSMAGTGRGRQHVLVRADLLIAPARLVSTSFQMEYLPSGLLCRGVVKHVHAYGFEATCRVPSGARRLVRAKWGAAEGEGNQVEGEISARPLSRSAPEGV
jgi:sulfoxide reductase heme-binding subunit YedZ